jgi:hypothetical protein
MFEMKKTDACCRMLSQVEVLLLLKAGLRPCKV